MRERRRGEEGKGVNRSKGKKREEMGVRGRSENEKEKGERGSKRRKKEEEEKVIRDILQWTLKI